MGPTLGVLLSIFAQAPANPIQRWVPASVVINDYIGNELRADKLYKGPLGVFGRVEMVRRELSGEPYILLGGVDMFRFVRCTFHNLTPADEEKLGGLQPGAFVALRGVGLGKELAHVKMSNCTIAWTPGPTDDAELSALTVQSCLFKVVLARLDGGMVKPDAKKEAQVRAAVARVEKRVQAMKTPLLPCSSPAMWVAFACDGERWKECKEPAIQAILAKEERE
jgi:hypothetical protein